MFFSCLGCYITLSQVPCAIQSLLVIHAKYSSLYMYTPNSLLKAFLSIYHGADSIPVPHACWLYDQG